MGEPLPGVLVGGREPGTHLGQVLGLHARLEAGQQQRPPGLEGPDDARPGRLEVVPGVGHERDDASLGDLFLSLTGLAA